VINYDPFLSQLANTELADWAQQLPEIIASGLNEKRYGDLSKWKQALSQLPDLPVGSVSIDSAVITIAPRVPIEQHLLEKFRESLMALHPWRKGPFKLFGINIDTEWRSDLKWDRLSGHIEPLKGKQVLDIGCGSGYHCWRMRGAGAELVVGIDPSPLFICQFFALQKYVQDPGIAVLPMGIEQLPKKLKLFDTTFSMGILYHRRSPFDHLLELRDTLKHGGELVLETLVIEGSEGQVLVPEDRYARMGNVWFLPSCASLESWLRKAGFKDIQCIDVSTTSVEEQRRTRWMTFHSLEQFLDPDDPSKTVEGHPAPKRAIFTAKAP
jgi:tRNA (mo5U34)-methyltransferase